MRKLFAGAGALVLTAAMGACGNGEPIADEVSASTPAPTTETTPATPAATSATPTPTGSSTAAPDDELLSGTRQVTIVRVEGFEAGLSLLDDGRLGEADDDSGRQLFVPTPLAGDRFQVKSYKGGGGGPGTGDPVCWQVLNPGNTQPLRVEGADCAPDEPKQQFEITKVDGAEGIYHISNNSALLQHSPTNGLILEEPGDGNLKNITFRFNDNGAAPAQR
ncbi:hypothetical protein [Micromonospora sp. SH-82]|uniref:hypothetical protein n=1 Tax=Micromonospora sp. SH-82 TaxID=3132938 RepID=UPI003EB7597E